MLGLTAPENVQVADAQACWGLQAQQAASEVTTNPYKTLFSRRYRPQLIITVLVRSCCCSRLPSLSSCKQYVSMVAGHISQLPSS